MGAETARVSGEGEALFGGQLQNMSVCFRRVMEKTWGWPKFTFMAIICYNML